MTGMKTLVALRRNSVKPEAVMVDLVHNIAKYDAEAYAFAENSGILSINIAHRESLNDIDFRPLVGLKVFAFDNTGNPLRYQRLCDLIEKIDATLMLALPVLETPESPE